MTHTPRDLREVHEILSALRIEIATLQDRVAQQSAQRDFAQEKIATLTVKRDGVRSRGHCLSTETRLPPRRRELAHRATAERLLELENELTVAFSQWLECCTEIKRVQDEIARLIGQGRALSQFFKHGIARVGAQRASTEEEEWLTTRWEGAAERLKD